MMCMKDAIRVYYSPSMGMERNERLEENSDNSAEKCIRSKPGKNTKRKRSGCQTNCELQM
jgi:hypothetical protein